MVTFKKKVWAEYPIPFSVSIWGGDGIETHPVEDLDVLIEGCVDELRSDIYVTDYVRSGSMVTQLPDDAFAVVAGKLQTQFQGNRLVKVQFDASTKTALSRYIPVTITYRRKLSVETLDMLEGDFLIYAKTYVLWKMAEKEALILKSMILDPDNATINVDTIREFANTCKDRYESMKPEISIYPVGM